MKESLHIYTCTMAISLKEQLGQINQLHEISYHAPIFDKHYYDQQDHSEGQRAGRRMFYDFYAMELLWSFIGSGQIPKDEREKLIGLPDDDPRRDIILGKSHRFLPSAAVKVIDSMYEQVTNTVAKNLLAYVRLAVVQEFQYLVSQSHGWSQFRNSLVSKYNQKKTISKADFDILVDKHIPDMKPYPETIKRLLKYSKYFSEMHTSDDKDPFDVSRGAVKSAEKSTNEPYPEFPNGPAPEEPKTPESPDDTDYNAEPTSREFGKYGGPGQPKAPYPQDWSGSSASKDTGELPKIPGDEEDDEKGGEVKERLTEEYINPKKVKKVYAAINKAGITLDDIEKAYNRVPWGGAYGGPKWGAGAVALLKLAHAKKNLSTEDMNHIIDHIYDLQHNTGSLLNKGPMYIDDTDLNRRYKITDVARFIPFVSPVVKNLILRFQRFLHGDQAKADLEANMENLQKSPKLPITPEEAKKLTDLGFKAVGDHSFRVAIKFNNKAGQSVHGVYYEVSKHDVGTFDKGKFIKTPNAVPLFVVSDNLKADVKAFPTFEEAFQYVSSHKQDMKPGGSVGHHHEPHAPAIKSEKDMYIESHVRIKLSPDKEQQLLNLNIGWRKKGKKYYKAYFADGHRFHFYAFSDGSFLLSHDNKAEYLVYNDWGQALGAAKSMSAGAQEYPEKAEAQEDIDAALAGKILGPIVTTPAGEPATIKDYYLPSEEQNDLQMIVNSDLPSFDHDKYFLGTKPDGMVVVSRKKYHQITPQFSVGKLMDSSVGKPYKVTHYFAPWHKGESWPFGTWALTLSFIKQNISKLVNTGLTKPSPIASQQTPSPTASTTTPTAYSPSGKQLPPNSTSKSAYAVHAGIQSPPKHTLRLTKEDESVLAAIGFEPRMVGDDVWYIHKFASDTVKFFPNNTAKVLFTSKGSGMKVPGINGTIEKILAWLPTKYSLQTNKSPIDTGASTGVAAMHPPASNSGIKAGIMFEKTITDAGFVWDSMGNEYVDYLNGPGSSSNVLKIAPSRASALHFASGETKQFKDLASLIAYLKNEYPTQKKSNAVTGNPNKIQVFPSWMTQDQVDLMDHAGFQYKGPVSDSGYSYKNFSNGVPNDTIIAYPNNIYKVFDAAHDNWVDLQSAEEFKTYMGEKYGSSPSSTTPAMPSESPNTMSKEEEDAIAKIVSGIPGLKFKKGYLTEANSKKPQIQYVSISDEKGKPIFAVTKKRGKYVIYKVIDKTWDKVYEDELFGGITVYLQSVLKGHSQEKDTSQFSPDQLEWIETFVKTALPNAPVKVIKHKDNIAVTDDEGDVFRVSKKEGVPYTVRYTTGEYLPDYGYKFSFDTYDTFEKLAAGIMEKLSTYTQVLSAKKNKSTTGVNYLDEKLKQYGFKFHGPTGDGGGGTTKNGVVFDDDKHNRVIYYFDGSSVTYINDGSSSKFGAAIELSDVHGLLASLDKIFGSAKSQSKEDELFGGLVEEAAQMGGLGGPVMMGTVFEKEMEQYGFKWSDHNKSYINRELKQIVVITLNESEYKYTVFFINTKGDGKKETVAYEFLFDAIGPSGNLEKLKRKSKSPSVAPSGAAEPSGETYKVTDNAVNESLLKLNEHDRKLMEYCGFNFTPAENWYYKDGAGSIFKFYDSGRAEFFDATSKTAEVIEFDSIPHALKFAVAKYIAQTNPQKPTESSSPFSNQNYNTNPDEVQLAPISLNVQDSDLLEKIGFKWNLQHKWYVKKLDESETPALQEAGKKKKASPKKKGPPIQQFDLPLDTKPGYEVIYTTNNGLAAWTLTSNPDTAYPEIDARDGTIKEILDFVWHRWNGNAKIGKVAQPQGGNALPRQFESQIKKKGFRWKEDLGAYVKKFGQYDQEKIFVESSGYIKYYYVNAKGNEKIFDTNNPQTIVNMISANAYNKAYAKLYGLGYKEAEVATAYTAGEKISTELYKDSTKEIIQVLSTGIVKYGALTWHNGSKMYVPYMNFDNIEDAAQYLTPKSATASGVAVKASEILHNNLVNNFGFKIEGSGAYTKGNQNIVFDKGGIINYHYVGNMGEIVTYGGSWNDKKQIDDFIDKLQQNNPEETFVYSNPLVRIRAMLQTEEKLVKKYGYKWDEGTKQYVKLTDPLNSIVFMPNKIHYYPTGGSGKSPTFSNENELFSYLDKEKSPQKENFYKEMMKTLLQ